MPMMAGSPIIPAYGLRLAVVAISMAIAMLMMATSTTIAMSVIFIIMLAATMHDPVDFMKLRVVIFFTFTEVIVTKLLGDVIIYDTTTIVIIA
jgi:hypothetical protein